MIIEAARQSAREILKPRFRGIMWKSIGLTVLLFFGMWLALDMAATTWLFPYLAGWPWITTLIIWLLGAGVIIGAGFLLAPTTAIFAGLFLDDVARHVEETHYPQDRPGKPMAIGSSIWVAIKFTLLVIGANLLALMLVLFAGMGIVVFFVVNGYLLGREYFQFAAQRFKTELEANAFRKEHRFQVFLAGLIIAGVISIPVLNLFTPVFAAGMMVHLHKALSGDEMAPVFGR